MYEEIINHASTSDDLRRSTEGKLFRYRLKYMKALPSSDPVKAKLLDVIEEMMRGTILIGVADELVWVESLETRDVSSVGESLICYRSLLWKLIALCSGL